MVSPSGSVFAATIEQTEPDGRVQLRSIEDVSAAHTARLAHIPGYQAAVGDRVLACHSGNECYVIAAIHTAQPAQLLARDGSTAELRNGELQVRDAAGRLLVRYADGEAEICAPSRDLRLTAPNGQVKLEAGTDVCIAAARDMSQRAGRKLTAHSEGELAISGHKAGVKAHQLDVETHRTRVVAGQAEVVARRIATTAEQLAHQVERYELTAVKIVEKARDAFRDVTGLAQSRFGRARTLVRSVYSLRSRRAVLVSKQDTTIDGERILLG